MQTISIFINVFLILFLIILSVPTHAQIVPLGQEELVGLLNQELSGESAKRNLEYISRLHRMRGSRQYRQAIDFLAERAKSYKLESVEIIQIPADGKTMYGTQKARQAWNVDFAELWEVARVDNKWVHKNKMADWESIPLVVAQDSESGDVTADLVDIGKGTGDQDYAGKDLKGKLVLTSSQPESVEALAIQKYGAAGIISYAQNQKTAWWKENENLIRWGHLNGFPTIKTFAFMISLKQARDLQQRMGKGEIITLHAKVEAGRSSGTYDILTAVIPGSDPKLKTEEVAFTCHLDHPRPGANDNASGVVTILEVARALNKLMEEGRLQRPRRTLRFIWSPEIEGTTILLNHRPDLANRIKFNIHMDMVGGGPETKALFHVSRSPQSLPTFVTDVGIAFGSFLNKSSDAYASGEEAAYPMVAEEGGKEALQAVLGEFHMGSDFEVYSEGSFRIPAIYLHDWPDRYIHTNYDVPANIDPTKLKRSGFIGAASGYVLANLHDGDVPALLELMKEQLLLRSSVLWQARSSLSQEEQDNATYYFWQEAEQAFNSLSPFVRISAPDRKSYMDFIVHLKETIGTGRKMGSHLPEASFVYARDEKVKGPMSVFGYDYFVDHYGAKDKLPALLDYQGRNGSGGMYTYEALNLVNGKNTVMEIRNILSAEFGSVPLELVTEYLAALESIGVIHPMK